MKGTAMNRIVIIIAIALLPACGKFSKAEPTKKQEQALKATEAAESISFNENAEIDNIKRRLEITSQPGKIGYVVLLNEAGQPILYTSVKGKVTSGSKRLTRPYDVYEGRHGGYGADFIVAGPSDEGTYGHSSPYIYFWTHEDRYVQWSGDYLYSDQPIRLRVEPLVINIAAEGESKLKPSAPKAPEAKSEAGGG